MIYSRTDPHLDSTSKGLKFFTHKRLSTFRPIFPSKFQGDTPFITILLGPRERELEWRGHRDP